MNPLYRGIAVAGLHVALVFGVAGKYALDREHLPRAWVKTAPVDPNLPIRGRYVSLRLELSDAPANWGPARLAVVDGRLVAIADPKGTAGAVRFGARPWTLNEPVAYFIPEHVPDPSRRPAGEELWVEVSVPRNGPPRPIRLGVRKNGALTPLPLD